jgi:hypothetical protein
VHGNVGNVNAAKPVKKQSLTIRLPPDIRCKALAQTESGSVYIERLIRNDLPHVGPPEGYMNNVIRAFWRRVFSYRNDFQKELPEKMPASFQADMETAMLALREYKLVQTKRGNESE